jgi:ABC-type Mn2+/Zn2+ transport system permease subunit
VFETLLLVKWPLAGALLASLPLAYYGVFLLERKMVFVSVALAQAALCGAATALLWNLAPRFTSLLFVAAAIAVLAVRGQRGRNGLPEDALLGVLYVSLGALAVVLISKAPHGGLDEATLLFGSLLGVTARDVAILLSVSAPLAVIHFALHKRFLGATFDPETSKVLGVNVLGLELAFFGGLGAILAVAIGQIGVLLSFAYLVLPAAASRTIFRSTFGVFVGAGIIGAAGSLGGTLASIHWDVPTGAAICLALVLPLPIAEAWQRLGAGARRGSP